MAANQSNLATTFTAPPQGQLVDPTGLATQRYQIWLNALFKRFLIQRTNLVQVSSNYAINLSDCTLQCILKQPNPIVLTLPDVSQIQGQIYYIKNDVTSVSTVSMSARANVLIDNQLPSATVLAPGQAVILECDGKNWIKLASFSTAVNSSSQGSGSTSNTTNVGGSGGGISNGGTGLPTGGTPVPPGTPVVTVLPVPPDPLAVIGQVVIFNGVPYIFSADPAGGPVGFWKVATVSSATIFDTHANRASYPAGSYTVGTLYYETDTTVSYVVQNPSGVNQWMYYNGIRIDVLANIPTLGILDVNYTFQASDYKQIWIWNGTAWNFAPGSGSGYFVYYASPSFLPYGLWGACDGSTYQVSQNDATTTAVVTPSFSTQYIRR